MSSRRSKLKLLLGSALLVALMAASSAVGQSGPKLNALLVGGLDHQEVFDALIPICEEQLGVEVEWSALPRDQLVIRATTLGQAGSDSIDVYSTHYSSIPQFYQFLEPLQSYFTADEL